MLCCAICKTVLCVLHEQTFIYVGGTFFGFREGESLFTHDGVEAGQFAREEIYGADGAYLGEVMNGMLLRSTSKSSSRRSPFIPQRHAGYGSYTKPDRNIALFGI
jgi:hypothetical protein